MSRKDWLALIGFALWFLGVIVLKHMLDTDWLSHPSNDLLDFFR